MKQEAGTFCLCLSRQRQAASVMLSLLPGFMAQR